MKISLVFLQIYVSSSFDATTHFETTCQDIIRIYESITGEPFNFEKLDAKFEEFKHNEG